jgi:hypothetical protein
VSQNRRPFVVRPIGVLGSWATSDKTFRVRARRLLTDLRSACDEIKAAWPADVGQAITDRSQHPELWEKCEHRDTLADSIRMTTAMAIEGFLNFYGVYRLGQEEFDARFERLGLERKLRSLLLACDQIDLPQGHILIAHLERVAQSRNALAHPKTTDVTDSQPPAPLRVPEEAEEVVSSMESFFDEFVELVPDAAFLLKQR